MHARPIELCPRTCSSHFIRPPCPSRVPKSPDQKIKFSASSPYHPTPPPPHPPPQRDPLAGSFSFNSKAFLRFICTRSRFDFFLNGFASKGLQIWVLNAVCFRSPNTLVIEIAITVSGWTGDEQQYVRWTHKRGETSSCFWFTWDAERISN